MVFLGFRPFGSLGLGLLDRLVLNQEISRPVLHRRQVLARLDREWPLVLLKVGRWLLLRRSKFPLRVPHLRCGQVCTALVETPQLFELLLVPIMGVVLRPRLFRNHFGALLATQVAWNDLRLLERLVCRLRLLLWLGLVGCVHVLELGEVVVDLVDGDRACVVFVQDSKHARVLLLVNRELHLHLERPGVHQHALFLRHCARRLHNCLRIF